VSALVRWLPELAVATADDIAQYGPNAARVRTLLDFLPTISDDAARASDAASVAARRGSVIDALTAARRAARDAAVDAARDDALGAARSAAVDTARRAAMRDKRIWAMDDVLEAAKGATRAEVVSDLISPENYRILTNPLATGRAVDVLAPRYKDTQFRELLQELGPKKRIAQPSDVLTVGRIARSPEEIREIALTLIEDGGMTVEEAYNAARMLA
jgi:hypothetical protein